MQRNSLLDCDGRSVFSNHFFHFIDSGFGEHVCLNETTGNSRLIQPAHLNGECAGPAGLEGHVLALGDGQC